MQTDDYKSLKEILGIEKLGTEEQTRILEMTEKRLNDVLLNTIIDNLSNEQAEEIRKIIADENDVEERISAVTARVPMLARKIDIAIQKEILALRSVIAG